MTTITVNGKKVPLDMLGTEVETVYADAECAENEPECSGEWRLNGAKRAGGGYPIRTYDDGNGGLYISRNSIGINGIVRAGSWEDAYSICEDEFFPEAAETMDQIIAEYGFKQEHWADNELFQESFGFRPSGPRQGDVQNHGIYAKDLNGDALDRLTPELLGRLNIVLDISLIS